jgi:hypothetical protein
MNLQLSILFSLIVLTFNTVLLKAQDVDVFKRDLNDHFNIPQLPDSMKYEEFKILSTDLRLMDAAEALIVPGLAHFKIHENGTGYSLVAARLLGYAGIVYVNVHNENLLSDALNYEVLKSKGDKTDYYIGVGSIGLVLASYLYDWIHARALLDQKQQKIRYKYAVKLRPVSVSYRSNDVKLIPELCLQMKF